MGQFPSPKTRSISPLLGPSRGEGTPDINQGRPPPPPPPPPFSFPSAFPSLRSRTGEGVAGGGGKMRLVGGRGGRGKEDKKKKGIPHSLRQTFAFLPSPSSYQTAEQTFPLRWKKRKAGENVHEWTCHARPPKSGVLEYG